MELSVNTEYGFLLAFKDDSDVFYLDILKDGVALGSFQAVINATQVLFRVNTFDTTQSHINFLLMLQQNEKELHQFLKEIMEK